MPWRPPGCAEWAKQFCKVHAGWPARKFAGFFVGRDCGPKKKPAPLTSRRRRWRWPRAVVLVPLRFSPSLSLLFLAALVLFVGFSTQEGVTKFGYSSLGYTCEGPDTEYAVSSSEAERHIGAL